MAAKLQNTGENMKNHRKCAAGIATSGLALAMTLLSQPVRAEDASARGPEKAGAEAPPAKGEIIVSARKRREDILKVPVTVNALTSADLEARGVATVSDAANATPGINIATASSGGGHADRSFQQVNLRGFTPTSATAVTTSIFIDGVSVSSPTALSTIADPAQIEVLKGPQAAYFGRNTFAGAINIVNKEPGKDWHASVSGMYGTCRNLRVQGAIEGPVTDWLTFRATVGRFQKGGSWQNAATGQMLGDQSSTNGTLYLVAKPSTSLTVKLFGMIASDDDGPSAQTRLLAYNVTNGSGVTYVSQSNCVMNGNPYFCGAAPGVVNPVGAMTTNNAWIRNFLNTASPNRVVQPSVGVQGFGLLRHTQHVHGTAEYVIDPHLTATVLAGYNHEDWSQLTDLPLLDFTQFANPSKAFGSNPSANPSYYSYPYYIDSAQQDYSLEGRVAYKYGAVRGVVGVSWLDAESRGGGGYFSFSSAGDPVFSQGGRSRARNFGAFFGITWDATDRLSLNLEGRYQIDTITAYQNNSSLTTVNGTFAPFSVLLSKSYKNFLPRGIVNYQINPNMMVYGSVSLGVNPGQFNSAFLQYTPSIQASLAAAGLKMAVDPEKITNYEIGLKGKLADGAIRYQLAGYYSLWRNQMNTIYQAVYNSASNAYDFVGGVANTGSVDLFGAEAQALWKVNDLVSIDAAGAYNGSRINRYANPTLTTLTGITDFRGKEMPLASKYSANVGVTLGGAFAPIKDARWFWRTDWNFKSGVWASAANVTRTRDLHIFNTRVGMTKGDVTLELFANNLFNNRTITGIYDNWTIDPNAFHFAAYSALHAALPDLRTMGVQMRLKF